MNRLMNNFGVLFQQQNHFNGALKKDGGENENQDR
jgi:hypothetical protein